MTPQRVVLREYRAAELDLSSDQIRAVLAFAPALRLAPTTTAHRYVVTASDTVGMFAVPGLDILVRPKIGIENLFLLLDSGGLADSFSTPDTNLASGSDFLAVFIDFFARSVHRATSRGLIRNYRQHEEALVAPRGRIDIAAHVRRGAVPGSLDCRFDEYTADVLENQLLLGTVERLVQLTDLAPPVRQSLRVLRARFEEVTPRPPALADFDRITHSRMTEHYRGPLRLARLIAENMSLTDRHGALEVGSFLLDMPNVYEAFVTTRLRHHMRGLLTVNAQEQNWLDVHDRVRIRPDLVFRQGSRPVLVGDVKYKLSSDGLARSSDYFQLLAYCEMLGLRDGVLVYAQTEGTPPVQDVVIKHSGRRLSTYRLDVGGPPAAIDGAVSQFAEWIVHRSIGSARADCASEKPFTLVEGTLKILDQSLRPITTARGACDHDGHRMQRRAARRPHSCGVTLASMKAISSESRPYLA